MSFILLGILNSQAAGAAGAGAYDLLETQTLGTAAASVTFTGLDSYSDYKHLQLRVVSKEDSNSSPGLNNMKVQFNSDTGSNYAYHNLEGNGSAVGSFSGTSRSSIFIRSIQRLGTDSNTFAAMSMDILDFSNTSKYSTIRALYGGTSSGNNEIGLQSGLWMNTNAITSIFMQDSSSSNFVAGSRFSLYGIK